MKFSTVRHVLAPSLLACVASCGSVEPKDPATPDAGATDTPPPIDTTPVGAAPVNATTSGTVAEAGTMPLAGRLVSADSDTPASGLTYTLRALPTHGSVSLNGTPLAVGGTFTQDDVTSGKVSYLHDGAESTTDNFTWNLSDGGNVIPTSGATTFDIVVTPVNDSPTIVNNPLTSFAEGGTQVLGDTQLLVTDAENTLLTFTLVAVTRGQLQKKNSGGTFVAIAANATFTQQDITTGSIRFVDPGTDDAALKAQMSTVASFSWRVADADGALNPPTGANVSTFTITAVDDAPTVSWRSQSCQASSLNIPANPLTSLTDPDNVQTDYTVCLVSIGLGVRVSPPTSTQGGSTDTEVPVQVQNGTTTITTGACFPATTAALQNLNLDSNSGNVSRGSLTWKLVKAGVQVGPVQTVQFPGSPSSC